MPDLRLYNPSTEARTKAPPLAPDGLASAELGRRLSRSERTEALLEIVAVDSRSYLEEHGAAGISFGPAFRRYPLALNEDALEQLPRVLVDNVLFKYFSAVCIGYPVMAVGELAVDSRNPVQVIQAAQRMGCKVLVTCRDEVPRVASELGGFSSAFTVYLVSRELVTAPREIQRLARYIRQHLGELDERALRPAA